MKIYLMAQNSLLIVLLSLVAFTVKADPRVGNGGGAWVCSDSANSSVRWIQLVDLFEAKNEYGLTVRTEPAYATLWSIYDGRIALLQSISQAFAGLTLETQAELQKRIQMVPPDTGLEEIQDALVRVFPSAESCTQGYLYYGQLANFTQDGSLLLDSRLWNLPILGLQGQGALLVHEAIYKALRDHYQEQNSARTRQIVGVLFSTLPTAEMGTRIDKIVATPELTATNPVPASCVAKVQLDPAKPAITRNFQLTGDIDRATIGIGDYEFSVDVDGQEGDSDFGKITNIEIHNLKTDKLVKKSDFAAPPLAGRPAVTQQIYSASFPMDDAGQNVSVTCARL